MNMNVLSRSDLTKFSEAKRSEMLANKKVVLSQQDSARPVAFPQISQAKNLSAAQWQAISFGSQKPALPATQTPESPKPESIVGLMVRHGQNPDMKNRVALTVSKHFASEGKEQTLSFGELLEQVQRVSKGLKKQGVKAGDKIALAEMNTPEFMVNYLAGLSLEATMVPLNLLTMQDERTKTDKFLYMLEKPKVNTLMIGEDPSFKALENLPKIQRLQKLRWLLGPMVGRQVKGEAAKNCVEKWIRNKMAAQAKTEQGMKDLQLMLERLPKGLKIITPANRVKLTKYAPLPVKQLQVNPKPDQIADILYTSGTSGDPKGVKISQQNLEFTVDSISKIAHVFNGPDDKVLMALPLFHIFGKAIQFTVMKFPTPVVMIPSLKDARQQMDKVVDTIHDYKITVFPSVPVILEAFVKHLENNPQDIPKVKGIRTIVSGGAALKSDTFAKLEQMIPGVKVCEGYGSSEGGIDMLNLQGVQGFVGGSLPGIEVKLHDMDPDTGAGEIYIKSPGVSKGYLEGTASADDQKVFQSDGWYKTGDVARFDDTTQMYQIVGRNSDVIKVAGERRPAESFELAMKETGLVSDAMALAYKPDRETEKAVVVAITDKANLSEADVKKAMGKLATEKKIEGWTIPKHVLVLNRKELPHGFVGFKRQYAAARDFVKKAVADQVVRFVDEADASGKVQSRTEVPNAAKFQQFAEDYRYTPAKKG
jgi:long-chain acyl-CoA synthetase